VVVARNLGPRRWNAILDGGMQAQRPLIMAGNRVKRRFSGFKMQVATVISLCCGIDFLNGFKQNRQAIRASFFYFAMNDIQTYLKVRDAFTSSNSIDVRL
jgi:hypothetical protein